MSSAHAGHQMPTGDSKALKITGWLTGIYFLIELAIGYWSGSVAVISDAFHTFSAVGGVLIALVAIHYASKPASPTASYGLIRAEIIGALFNGLFLLIMAIYVFWMGYQRLRSPIEIPPGPMLLAAAGGLITEFISLWLLFGRQKDNLNMKGALWHVIQTFVGSIIIIVAALVIKFTGFYQIDPILGMLFGVVLFWASWGIIRDSTRILLQVVPDDFDLKEMLQTIEAFSEVKDVHHAHVWSLTSGKNIVSMHVLVQKDVDKESLLNKINHVLKEKFSVYFSTTQIETNCPDTEETPEINVQIKQSIKEGHAH